MRRCARQRGRTCGGPGRAAGHGGAGAGFGGARGGHDDLGEHSRVDHDLHELFPEAGRAPGAEGRGRVFVSLFGGVLTVLGSEQAEAAPGCTCRRRSKEWAFAGLPAMELRPAEAATRQRPPELTWSWL